MNMINSEAIIRRIGGWYIVLSVLASQIIGLLGAIPGIVFLQINLELNENISSLLGSLIPITLIVSHLAIIILIWQFTSDSRIRLDEWKLGQLKPNAKVELSAWKELTNLSTLYGLWAFVIHFVLNILPPFFITISNRETISSVFQPGTIASPVPVYILLGGSASLFGTLVLSLLLLERFTLVPRLILLPNDFESQLSGRTGVLIGTKFQFLSFGLLLVSIAIFAPLGYQQAIRILYSEVSSFQIFEDLRTWSLTLSLLAILLGAAFSYLASKSITDPINEMIDTFRKIEQGDLSQRVAILATDELGTVAMNFNRMVARLDNLQSTLEQQVKERTKQLSATNEVGRVASSILDPEELLAKTVNLITQHFEYYYAAIYLVDTSEKWADLKEATGQTGSVLKQNRHRLELSGKSMVATCIREKSPRIAQNTLEEKLRFENPLLPYTRSEIALPLIIGDHVLGALNVQSTKEADFNLNVIETMHNLTGQIAISLENARLFQEAQKSIQELRAIQKQYLAEGWSNISSTRENLEYTVGDSTESSQQFLASNINLRDQEFGQIILETSQEWTQEQQIIVDAVATQAAIALENARLVSESRQVALRERTLAEINSKIWASTSIEGILQTVIKELGKRLDATNATIELNVDKDYDK